MAGLGKSDFQDVHVGFRPTCTSYLRRRVCGSFSKTDGVSLEVATSILGGLFRRMHPHILGFWFDFLGLSRGMRISGVCAFSAVSRNMIILGLSLRFFHRPPQCLRFFRHPSPRRPSRHTCTSSTPPTSRHAVTQSMSKACGQIWVPGGFPSEFCREGISTHVRAHIHA